MRIDAHQHYWKISRGDYGWLTPELPQLYRDFLPEHLLPHLREHRLDGTIVVQAAPTLEETDYILSLAEADPTILGVVGWLDLYDASHRQHFESFRQRPKFVGFRTMIQEMEDARNILQPNYVEALQYYASEDVPVDLLVRSDQLDPLVNLIDRVPGLRGVIDHIAKPKIKDGVFEPWSRQIEAIAQHAGIYCKLSGMVTEADHKHWRPQQLTAYIRHALKCFGPKRVMFGSDWPVCLLAAEYRQVIEALEQALPEEWTEEDKQRLFGQNAREFYKLP